MRPNTEQQTQMVRDGRADDLLKLADRASALDAKDPWPFEARATVYHMMGRFEDAIVNVQWLVEQDGVSDPRYRYWLGDLYRSASDYVRAIDHYSAVIRDADPYFLGMALFFRAECYLSIREYEKAIADCKSIRPGFRLFERTPAMILSDAKRGLGRKTGKSPGTTAMRPSPKKPKKSSKT